MLHWSHRKLKGKTNCSASDSGSQWSCVLCFSHEADEQPQESELFRENFLPSLNCRLINVLFPSPWAYLIYKLDCYNSEFSAFTPHMWTGSFWAERKHQFGFAQREGAGEVYRCKSLIGDAQQVPWSWGSHSGIITARQLEGTMTNRGISRNLMWNLTHLFWQLFTWKTMDLSLVSLIDK